MNLDGKVAVVTGGAQGIGRSYSLRFAEEGAAVAVLDLREDQALLARLGQRGLQPVAEKQGRQMAQTIGALDYFEVSCEAPGDPLEPVFVKGIELVFGVGEKKKPGRSGSSNRNNCAVF